MLSYKCQFCTCSFPGSLSLCDVYNCLPDFPSHKRRVSTCCVFRCNSCAENLDYASVGGAPRYTVVVLCVSPSVRLSVFPSHVSLQRLIIKC